MTLLKLAARNLSLTKSDLDGIFDTTFEQIATGGMKSTHVKKLSSKNLV